MWAEEAGALSNSNTQYSFGNGATGNIGIPLKDDWLLHGVSFQADGASAGGTVSIEVMDFATGVNVIANAVFATSQTNNYSGIVSLADIPVPEGSVLGFRTNIETGAFTDARAVAWLRRRG